MLGVEEVLSELGGEELNEQGLPPGFRFHPTDEELITFYLASKVFNGSFCGVEIAEVDLNRCEPWELPDVAKMGEREWYFFSLRDRKYPTGLRTNRATGAGYWKATGKDREVYSSSASGRGASSLLLGMKKTLVFYKGRAPRGEKTKWVMHEYRLDGDFSYRHTCKEEWVICRIFHKNGEKKNGVNNALGVGQSYMLEVCSSSTTTSTSLQNNNTFVIQRQEENDLKLKSLINPLHVMISQSPLYLSNGFSDTTTTDKKTVTNTNINNINPSSSSAASMLFKSLLSHQDCIFNFKEQAAATIPKQCKTEANFFPTNFQQPNNDVAWMDKIQYPNPNPCQNPLYNFDMDCGHVFGFSEGGVIAPAGDTSSVHVHVHDHDHDMFTSTAFNRAGVGVQMMLDPPNITTPSGESWPLDC